MSKLATALASGLIAAGVVAGLFLAGIVALELTDHEPGLDNPSLRPEVIVEDETAVVRPFVDAPDPRREH
ncbi:MAG: hypothetical protein ACRDPQ_21360 [Nocardioidaceae bacterium]